MLRVSGWTSLALLLGLSAFAGAAAPPPPPVRTAISKALPLLVKGGRGHMEQRNCFACHNQGPLILALTTARERGFPVRKENVQEQTELISDLFSRKRSGRGRRPRAGGDPPGLRSDGRRHLDHVAER
jgi:hypothetical protein